MQKEKAVSLDSRTAAENRPVWIQIARVGTWAGHPSGPFQLGPKEFEDMCRAFKSGNQRVPIDFEHASEMDPRSGSVPTVGAPAQGWITALDNRGADGLWALAEWLEPARTYIKEGKYKYFSPTIRFNARDPVTGIRSGCRLSSGALTNQPFLSHMAPLAAKDTNTGDIMPDLNAVRALANNYTDRLVADGHTPQRAHALAMARAGREIAAAMNTGPSEAALLAERVRDREPGVTIVQLVDRLMTETPGLDREQAYVRAERLLRAR